MPQGERLILIVFTDDRTLNGGLPAGSLEQWRDADYVIGIGDDGPAEVLKDRSGDYRCEVVRVKPREEGMGVEPEYTLPAPPGWLCYLVCLLALATIIANAKGLW